MASLLAALQPWTDGYARCVHRHPELLTALGLVHITADIILGWASMCKHAAMHSVDLSSLT
jgi:hypothetical protein